MTGITGVDSAYQYYLSTYRNSDVSVSRYDTHKKSQLRDIYNRIVKANKESPLYKIKESGDVKKYAIDIKESTRNMKNVIASLSDSGRGIESVFSKKIAQSSNEDVVLAEYIGREGDSSERNNGFSIQVNRLATGQTNIGNYLNSDRLDIEPGSYNFDLNTNTSSYEFQYTVSPNDTNRTLQHKLAKLIEGAGIGLNASVVTNESGHSALSISTRQTGIGDTEDYLFQILPSAEPSSIKAMRALGIDHVETNAQNSSFLLNGTEHSSYSNTFTVNNAFDITLRGVNKNGEATQIGFKTNADAVADNVEELVDAYNGIIQVGHQHSDGQAPNKLVRDISSVARDYRNELEAIGLNIERDSQISVDRSLLTDAVTAEDAKESFVVLNNFKDSLDEKSTEASIDPMNYVNKIVVTYKNPGHNFATPYITSIYSGMMMDFYC